MKTICIYYIATGKYKKYFNSFYKSLTNFFPDVYKHIIYFNDNNKLKNNFNNKTETNNISIEYVYIPHMMNPIIGMCKHWWIINNKKEGYDAYFYFNANSEILAMSDECKNSIIDAIDNDIFITSYNSSLYNQIEDFIKFNTRFDKNPLQTKFFGGSYNTFYNICEMCVDYISKSLEENKIPESKDDTAFKEVIWDDFIQNRICIHLYCSITQVDNPYHFILIK